jgi:hypothetical protein
MATLVECHTVDTNAAPECGSTGDTIAEKRIIA